MYRSQTKRERKKAKEGAERQAFSVAIGGAPASDHVTPRSLYRFGSILVNWAAAEREMAMLVERMGGVVRNEISKDCRTAVTWVRANRGGCSVHANRVKETFEKLRNRRNALAHGEMTTENKDSKIKVENNKQIGWEGPQPLTYGPIQMRHQRTGTNVQLDERTLIELDEDVRAWLKDITSLVRELGFDMVEFSATLRMEDDAPPEMHFGGGKREVEVKKMLRVSDVFQMAPMRYWACKECGEVYPKTTLAEQCHGAGAEGVEGRMCHACGTMHWSPCEHQQLRGMLEGK